MEEAFNNQMDRMTYFVDTSQTPSPANRLMNKVVTVAGMEVIHGLSNKDFYSPRAAI